MGKLKQPASLRPHRPSSASRSIKKKVVASTICPKCLIHGKDLLVFFLNFTSGQCLGVHSLTLQLIEDSTLDARGLITTGKRHGCFILKEG